jgi:hypothetical protein
MRKLNTHAQNEKTKIFNMRKLKTETMRKPRKWENYILKK